MVYVMTFPLQSPLSSKKCLGFDSDPWHFCLILVLFYVPGLSESNRRERAKVSVLYSVNGIIQ